MTGIIKAPDLSYLNGSNNENPKIIFWNWKDYWRGVLQNEIIPKFKKNIQNSICIPNWEAQEYSPYESVIDTNGNLKNSQYSSDALHVFIAPITWAGLYTRHFSIFGPAFATYGDIRLYNFSGKRKNDYHKKSNDKIRIGVIDNLATSTICLQIIMNGICKQIGNAEKLDLPISEAQFNNRYAYLADTVVCAAVFNEQDFANNNKSDLNNLVDIDELYALGRRISSLPRVVYAISKKQLNDIKFKSQIDNLINVLCNIKTNWHIETSKTHILAPFDENNRNAIIDFLKDGKKVISKLSREVIKRYEILEKDNERDKNPKKQEEFLRFKNLKKDYDIFNNYDLDGFSKDFYNLNHETK